VITEGEKKAAAACQSGLIAAGVGGVWNWSTRLNNGERLVLPLLEEFVWTERSVLMCPDSDAWQPGKELKILAGFFALAKELQSRGASVQFVVLPDLPGRKCGLDDWLLIPGNSIEHAWPGLQRLPLTDARFATLTAWWQNWKAKQAAEDSFRTKDAEHPHIDETAGLFTVAFPSAGVTFTFGRLSETQSKVSAELRVKIGATEILGETDLSLKSESSRSTIVRILNGLAPHVAWNRYLERACTGVLQRHRNGEPIAALQPVPTSSVPFQVNPIIYRGHQTLWYAPGGSLKSYLGLYVALVACHGAQEHGLAAVACPVLYLDWELNKETIGGRLAALRRGHPGLCQRVPDYLRCEAPLHQDVHRIAAHVAAHRIGLVIVDSVAMAAGGDLHSPDAAIKLQQALRQLGCASLVLAHVAKATPESGERSAYGTVFFRELARNVWELERPEGIDPPRVILCQKKNNFGKIQPPLAFAFSFEEEAVNISACDPNDEPALEAKLPLPSRISNALQDGQLWSATALAEELSAPLPSVKSTLSRFRAVKWQRIGENHEAKWCVLNR
jgi:hypothetical protein